MLGLCVAAHSACDRAVARSMPHFWHKAGLRIFRLPTTMGDLLMCTLLSGRRVTPSGRSAVLVNRRRRSSSALRPNSSRGSCAKSHTRISFLLLGCWASGQTRAMQPRSWLNMPEMCRKGFQFARGWSSPASASTALFWRSFRQKSHRRGWACLSKRARAMVARTSDRASWAASWLRPLAWVRCSSLKEGRPSSCLGHWMPSGRKAQVVRTTSSRSQRPQPFCHSRA